jgi:hypothetical protein
MAIRREYFNKDQFACFLRRFQHRVNGRLLEGNAFLGHCL